MTLNESSGVFDLFAASPPALVHASLGMARDQGVLAIESGLCHTLFAVQEQLQAGVSFHNSLLPGEVVRQ